MAAAAATRGVTIAFAGAAGAALFSYAETVSELAREVSRTVVHTLSKPKGSGQDDSSDGGTVALLTQQIDQLSKELRRIAGGQGREVRIVHEGGIDMLKGRLQGIRAHMQQQLDSLTRKHDESTAEIKEQITSDISLVQSQIAELGSAQGYANQGIYLLSRAVAELTGNANSKAVRELEAFTRTRPSVTYAYQSNGLRSVMGLTDGEDGQSGVVAQRTSFNSNGSTSNASNGLNDLL